MVQSDLAAIRTFNRYELKYLVDQRVLARVRPELSARLDHDAHGDLGSYPLWSRYYDTYDLRCYWEKIDGIKFRRKLRIRHYGPPHTLSADTPVWVEIKQRLNRVTQKRRARLRYSQAVALCAGREIDGCEPRRRGDRRRSRAPRERVRPATEHGHRLRPRRARRPRRGCRSAGHLRHPHPGRDRDLDLSVEGENRFIVHPDLCVLEVKVNERVPYWLTELIARNNLQLVRMSKYCQSVEAFDGKPRSLFHSLDEDLYEMESGS